MDNLTNVLIIAGEISGDNLASGLVNALLEISPSISFWGIGGKLLKESGVEILHDNNQMAVMGFVELFSHYKKIKSIRNSIIREAKRRKPRIAILVDYPGFNLSLAPHLKDMGIKVIYYVCPQVWAWGYNRVNKLREYTDCVIPLLPFEIDLLHREGIKAKYFGHPLVEMVTQKIDTDTFKRNLSIEKPYILLLPGSRKQEIYYTLNRMLEGYKLIRDKYDIKGLIVSTSKLDEDISLPSGVKVIDGPCYSALYSAQAAVVASGSASTECALAGLPSIVVYKGNPLSYIFLRKMAKVKYISLTNILLDSQVFPELIQNEFTPENILSNYQIIMDKSEEIKTELAKVREILYKPDPFKNTAEYIYKEYLS